MPRGDWGSKLTLGLAVALYCFWVGAAVLSAFPLKEHAAEYQAQGERERADSEADQRAADLRAQQRMAVAAWAQVGIGALGLIGLGATVIFARNAWREAQRSADAAREANALAREQFHAQQRPWIIVEPFSDDTSIAHDESVITGDLKLTNIGPSPAINVGISGPSAWPSKDADPLSRMARRLARLKRLGRIGGRTLFPGRGYTHHFTVALDGLQKPLASPILLEGIVTYQWRPGGPIYSTPFILEVKFWREGADNRPSTTRTAESKWHHPPE